MTKSYQPIKRTSLWIAGALFLPAATLLAQDSMSTNAPPSSTPLFRDSELQLDLFGTYSAPQHTIEHLSGDRLQHTGRAGAGVGVSFFFFRYFGIGADAYTENTAGSFVDNLSGNLILRLPIDSLHVAPYIYGGGGHQWDPNQTYFGQFGAGVEVRITPHIGLFVDGRYVMTADSSPNFAMARGGLRISF